MFTGIVQCVGTIVRSEARSGDTRLWIDAAALDLAEVAIGDSICVSGVCLTAIELQGTSFAADVSVETLTRTTLGALPVGARVNLEKPLRLMDRLGGHLVSGHIDGFGTVTSITPEARSQRWTFELPLAFARYIAAKGSVCIDGASLTVNEVDGNRFGVNLIPHTIAATTFRDKQVGDLVNIEVDLIARYVERVASVDSQS